MTFGPAPLHWSEGMFLTPQHMQAFTKHVHGRLAQDALGADPFAWGIAELELDTEALKNYVVRVKRLDAILEDGTRIRVPDETEIPSREIREFFADGGETLTLYVGVPELRQRSPNVYEDSEEVQGVRRYRVKIVREMDENTGSNEYPIAYRQLQARVLLDSEDRAGFQTLRLGAVLLAGEEEPLPTLLPTDVPPVTRLAASPRLSGLFRDLSSVLAAKSRALGEQVAARRITWAGEGGGGDAELMMKLHVVNSALAVFRPLVALPGLRPLNIYLQLCGLIGQLAIFDSNRTPPELMGYDHDALGPCFTEAVQEARRLLDSVVPTSFVRRAFEVYEDGQHCPLDEGWFAHDVTLYLGAEADQEVQVTEQAVGRLKLAARADVGEVQRDRLSGIEKVRVERVPSQLPDRKGLLYWQIRRDGKFWLAARDGRDLALFGRGIEDGTVKYSLFAVSGKDTSA